MISLFVAPTELQTGSTTISLGLIHALDAQGIRVGFVKPIAPRRGENERSTALVQKVTNLNPPRPISLDEAQRRISQGAIDRLLEDIVPLYQQAAKNADVIIIEGLVPDRSEPFVARINAEIAKSLGAAIVLVLNGENQSPASIKEHMQINSTIYGGLNEERIIGCIINKIGAPKQDYPITQGELEPTNTHQPIPEEELLAPFWKLDSPNCPVLGAVPWKLELTSPRTLDVARWLQASIINKGELEQRRIRRISLCARTIPHIVGALAPGTLIVTPGDRDDILLASAMATTNGITLAGLVLTGDYAPDPRIAKLCQKAYDAGLPIIGTTQDSYRTAHRLAMMDTTVPTDDVERALLIMEEIAQHLDMKSLLDRIGRPRAMRLSPAAFRFQLVERARSNVQRIVLPEGEEPRTIQAAAICQTRGIAQCILLGKPDQIQAVAEAQGITLPSDLQIFDPDVIREHYVEPMVELRKHKQLVAPMALAQLEDNVVLGTMMLALDEVDGLVSGAIHTTANTIRPALQLIKTAPEAKLVSSVFFMCLPDQVLVYGDCAVNPDPNAAELADIALQSAASAKAMGIEPRVAMLSYSTGSSGQGADVEKVRTATTLAKQACPDLNIDGPLQYDAAITASVARSKAPDSTVAGRATVLIFPDLNTGNTTYKAVQRSANVVSIGPMLQGLRKPVNDLSRGALVEDIVYTIALTAIQAQQIDN